MDYIAGARTAATAATADTAAVNLWNPHASIRLAISEIHWFKTVATADNIAILRATTRGTQTTTVTPNIGNELGRLVAPPSGAVIDTAWSAQPAKDGAVYLNRANFPAAVASGAMWTFPEPLIVPPGAGICLVTPVATALQPADVTFRWAE